ncbi:MAG: lytic transglycosylase domain-containing protein [Firmicutes bacterium]|nr:lytic transglycosylase domain-containing protein [Bacillota bacterium]
MELRNKAIATARKFAIPEGIFLGLIGAESAWNPQAVSRTGAIGLTQVLPSTAAAMGYNPDELLADPGMQLEAGARYLREMFDRFCRWDYALAAYNARPHNVAKYEGIPPFKETRQYVQKILSYARIYEQIKKTGE